MSLETNGKRPPTDKPASPPREHFIPIRKADLAQRLASDIQDNDTARDQFQQLCRMLAARIHFDYHEHLEKLKNSYCVFDPDADTISLGAETENRHTQLAETLFDNICTLLERANYRELSKKDLDEALEDAGSLGFHLVIDFDLFQRLELYSRGITEEVILRRCWYRFFWPVKVHTTVYQRLVLMFRFTEHKDLPKGVDTDTVYLKVFKGIPKQDLDALLPGTHVKMTLFDQGKVFLPTATGIAMAVYKLIFFAVAGLFGMLALVFGLLGYAVKSFFGYMRTKEKHQFNLTQNLYFKNLDNNIGVLFRVLDEAEEQEFREAILAYFMLWRHAPSEGWTMTELDDVAENYLQTGFGIDADFEVDDAVDKLVRFRMVESDQNERFRAVPIETALVRLDEEWDNFFQYYNVEEEQTT